MGTAARSPRNGRKTAVAAVKPARRDLRSEKLAAALAGHKEAVEQQAATAEILRAISRSSGDPQPVFQAIVDNAHRLCGAMYTVLYGYDGEMLTVLASKHMSTEGRRVLAGNYPQAPSREKIIGRTVIDGRHFHSPDIAKDARFPESTKALPRRAVVAVPLINKGAVVGAISCGRAEAKAFSTRDISLLQTFADQAVIVIENARLFNQTKEALEQQTATSSILAVISSSPTDLAPVFDAILSKATALCEAHLGLLHLYDGEKFRTVAHRGDKPEYKRWVFERGSFKPEAFLLDLAAKREPIHIADIRDTAFYRRGKANAVKMADIAGGRSFLAVPLLKERQLVGSITIYRPDVRPFTAKQIALLQTFADQAVIAIENVRLFNGTKEALEQQTATSEVLKTISRSTFDLNAVLQVLIENATRLAGANQGFIFRFDGQLARLAFSHNARPAYKALIEANPILPGRGSLVGRTLLERRPVHIADVLTDQEFTWHEAQRLGGFRSMLGVPMMREGALIGVIAMWSEEVRPFTGKQISLVSTFADQAVIAIENVRLFNETKEALERQTASAEILRVISSAPADTQPVFDTIVENAQRLLSGKSAVLLLRRETDFVVAGYSAPGLDELPPEVRTAPLDREKNFPSRVILDGEVLHIPDWEADDVIEFERFVAKAYGIGSGVQVPLLRKGQGIGALVVTRQAKGSFHEKEIALLQSFADQAVIAIENARLFNETKEALEQQTAMSEVLRVISDSPTDVKPVLEAVSVRAAKICEATDVRIFLVDNDTLEHAAGFGDVTTIVGIGEALPVNRDSVIGRAVVDHAAIHVDLASLPAGEYPISRQLQEKTGQRTTLAMPLLREQRALGCILLRRMEVRPFTEKQIALLSTFADQAAIAIENVRLFNETKEALERQTATSGILQVISRSPTDVQPVFAAILESATRLCGAHFGLLGLYEGESYKYVAHHGAKDEFAKWVMGRGLYKPRATGGIGRMTAERRPIHIEDLRQSVPYQEGNPITVALADIGGVRTYLSVPMIKGDSVVGGITIYRPEVRPFAQKQIDLVSTFANQAVIAIENVRLFNETKEALEKQTAMAEILKVISGSPTDVQPVFDAIVKSAQRLMGGFSALVTRLVDDTVHLAAFTSTGEAGDEAAKRRYPAALSRLYGPANAIGTRAPFCVADVEADPAVPTDLRDFARKRGYRSVIFVPMLRGDAAVGTVSVTRREPGQFTDQQVELLKTFADQAVIAIENTRLFNELQSTNATLREALEQQTATGEILKVISSSHSDVRPVFETIVNNSVRLCEGEFGALFTYDGKVMDLGAHVQPNPEVREMFAKAFPQPIAPTTPSAKAILERRVVNVPDMLAEPDYAADVKERARTGGYRAVLTVPMMRGEMPIGAIAVTRREATVFSDSYVALLQTFADQAVIAIENVRLFKELEARNRDLSESLKQQTATAEVLKLISRTTFELEKVLQTLLDNATRLSGALRAAMLRPDEAGNYLPVVTFNYDMASPMIRRMHERPIRPGRDSITGRALLEKRPIHVPDVLADPEYGRRDLVELTAFRTVLAVPMLRDGEAIGLIALAKGEEVDPFTEKQMEVVTTFADQAVIAIENVRLFQEIQDKTRQLEAANKHKSDFLANMSHELRTPLNAIIGFSEVLMDRMFGELNEKQADYLKDIHESGKHLLSLINDILDLAKIEAGRMELELSSFDLPNAISNAMILIRERAQRHDIELGKEIDPRLGEFQADERKFKQILLNLLSNAVKFTPDGGRVAVSATLDTTKVEIAVRDSGVGIAPEDQAALFEEFRQVGRDGTRKAEGTGLGLALTRKFVELHGGEIRVESALGRGSTFTVCLPVR